MAKASNKFTYINKLEVVTYRVPTSPDLLADPFNTNLVSRSTIATIGDVANTEKQAEKEKSKFLTAWLCVKYALMNTPIGE